MKKNKKNLLAVCHDAGGAEIVSAFLKKHFNLYNIKCVVKGPAIKVFKRRGLAGSIISENKASQLLKKKEYFEFLLCGTSSSGANSIEVGFLQKAKNTSVKCAAYIEHWVNYRERFGYPEKNWRKNLPDEIWVGDKHALKMAKNLFVKKTIKLVDNLYWKECKAEYLKEKKKLKAFPANILFMSEPIKLTKKNSKIGKYGEFFILNSLLKFFSDSSVKNSIIICYHPLEKKDKYDDLIGKYKHNLTIRKQSKNRIKDMAQAKLVIGIRSMILVVASICGNKVISYIPKEVGKCTLPMDDVVKVDQVKKIPLKP